MPCGRHGLCEHDSAFHRGEHHLLVQSILRAVKPELVNSCLIVRPSGEQRFGLRHTEAEDLERADHRCGSGVMPKGLTLFNDLMHGVRADPEFMRPLTRQAARDPIATAVDTPHPTAGEASGGRRRDHQFLKNIQVGPSLPTGAIVVNRGMSQPC